MDVSVVIAYRDLGCPHRAASFRWVTDWYDQLGLDVVVESGDGEFSRAAAINQAVRRARGDVIVQSDPDSIVPTTQLVAAVQAATDRVGLVIPHDRYLYLNPPATTEVLAGRDPFDCTETDCDNFGTHGSGNVVVFSRDTWAAAGGFDERFGMWGGDDGAYAYACEAFCGSTRRLEGPMVHLWHPRLPQSIPGCYEYAEQFTLVAEYRDAAEVGPEAVREYVRAR